MKNLPGRLIILIEICHHCPCRWFWAKLGAKQSIDTALTTKFDPFSSKLLSTFMMTSSNGNIFRVTGPLCGEFTGPGEFPTQRPVTRSFDVFFDLRLNKRLSKHSWGWWFETLSWSLWRHHNVQMSLLWSDNAIESGPWDLASCYGSLGINTLWPRQNGRHFADDTFNRIFVNENVEILIIFSLKFVPKGPINNIPALVQIMAWRRRNNDGLFTDAFMRHSASMS